jgi:tRNA(adenine34) deaminase
MSVFDELRKREHRRVNPDEIGAIEWSHADQGFMRRALTLASRSGMTEVPVGAVLVGGGQILGEGWNHPISANDPTRHAEIDALRKAAERLGNYRLPGSTLYVTLEPCIMCAGAVIQARVERLVFGARDLRFGAIRSKFRLADSDLLNHRAKVREGLFAAEATELLANFFAARRKTGA